MSKRRPEYDEDEYLKVLEEEYDLCEECLEDLTEE